MSKSAIDNSENIILGSGDLYLVEFAGGVIPEDATIETDLNRAGNIKGGAALSYKMETKTVEDDKGRLKKTIVTKEDVALKTGLMTWSPAYIQLAIATARVDESSKSGHRITKIGGLANKNNKNYLLRFVHTRDDGRKLRVTVTGTNTGTAELKFDPEKESTIDVEVTCSTLDTEGTLVIIDDEQPKAE